MSDRIAAIARPGDTVLIGFAHQLTDEDIEALDESFRPLIEQGIKVGFMDQVTSMVVFRPDEPIPYELTGRTVTLADGDIDPRER